jgi:hypothetical protein
MRRYNKKSSTAQPAGKFISTFVDNKIHEHIRYVNKKMYVEQVMVHEQKSVSLKRGPEKVLL